MAGLLDEYPMGYFDVPIDPQPSFTMGGGLLAEPADTGFSQMAPFGGLLSGPAPAAAPMAGMRGPAAEPPNFLARLLGGGDPDQARSMLMSLGAGLLKSNGRLEGLGEGAFQGMRLGQQAKGQRQRGALLDMQITKFQEEEQRRKAGQAAWENYIRSMGGQSGLPMPSGGGADAPAAVGGGMTTLPSYGEAPAPQTMPDDGAPAVPQTMPDTQQGGFTARMPAPEAPPAMQTPSFPAAFPAAPSTVPAPSPAGGPAGLQLSPQEQALAMALPPPQGQAFIQGRVAAAKAAEQQRAIATYVQGLPADQRALAMANPTEFFKKSIDAKVRPPSPHMQAVEEYLAAPEGPMRVMLGSRAMAMASENGFFFDPRTGSSMAIPGGPADVNYLGRKSEAETVGRQRGEMPFVEGRAAAEARGKWPYQVHQVAPGANLAVMGDPPDVGRQPAPTDPAAAVPPLADRIRSLGDRIQRQESSDNPDAIGPVLKDKNGVPTGDRAVGLMQITEPANKDVARALGRDPFTKQELLDPKINRMVGDTYLGILDKRYDGNETLVSAAYNAGMGRVDGWVKEFGDPRKGEISDAAFAAKIPFDETRKYVMAVARPGAVPASAPPERGGTQVASNGPRVIYENPNPAPGTSEGREAGEIGADRAKLISETRSTAEKSGQAIESLRSQRNLIDKGFQTGYGSTTRAYVSTILQGVGVPEQFANRLTGGDPASLRLFQANANEIVQQVAKSLGANPTDNDARLLAQTIAQASDAPAAAKAIIDYKLGREQRNVDKWQALYDWKFNQKKDPLMFDVEWQKRNATPAAPAQTDRLGIR